MQSLLTACSAAGTAARSRAPRLRAGILGLALILGAVFHSAAAQDRGWVFLNNGQVCLGVKTNHGAGIGWFSESGSPRNLINDWDTGRLVQQSYYGQVDGSVWGKKPWRWNPVQGGDYFGHGARTLELRARTNSLYAKTMAKHWASGADLPEVMLEEWISLTGKVAQVRFKMTYSGQTAHPKTDQEVPAFFVQPDLDTLVLYDGKEPWTNAPVSRSRPGWPNESRRMAEHWAAYVDKNDFGVGALVPVADHLTCYRFGDGQAQHGSCSYFAPIIRFAITPRTVFEYDLFMTLGRSAEIRDTFRRINGNAKQQQVSSR